MAVILSKIDIDLSLPVIAQSRQAHKQPLECLRDLLNFGNFYET